MNVLFLPWFIFTSSIFKNWIYWCAICDIYVCVMLLLTRLPTCWLGEVQLMEDLFEEVASVSLYFLWGKKEVGFDFWCVLNGRYGLVKWRYLDLCWHDVGDNGSSRKIRLTWDLHRSFTGRTDNRTIDNPDIWIFNYMQIFWSWLYLLFAWRYWQVQMS